MAEKTRYSDAELEEFRASRVVSSLESVLAPSSNTLYVGDVSSVSLPSSPIKLFFYCS